MKLKSLSTVLLLLAGAILIGAGKMAYAADSTLPNPLGISSFPELVQRILNVLLTFAVPIEILLIVYAGFLFLTSGGNPSKRSSAQEVLKWAVIGFMVMLSAWLLVNALRAILV